MVPLVVPGLTVILLLVEEPVHPEGNVHKYLAAFGATGTENVCALSFGSAHGPAIPPGITGIVFVTFTLTLAVALRPAGSVIVYRKLSTP